MYEEKQRVTANLKLVPPSVKSQPGTPKAQLKGLKLYSNKGA